MMRNIHRRLAWIAGLVAVLWAATGFLHPIMSWTAPRAAAMSAPHVLLSLEGVAAPGPALQALRWDEARAVRLIAVEGAAYWLAFDQDGRSLAVNARTGAPGTNAERDYAIALARHYTGRPNANVASVERLTGFSLNYPAINRVLPVWDVRFADGLSAYVDTRADRLVTQADPTRRALLLVFQNVHTLSFLSGVEPVRKALLLTLIATALASAIFGFVMAIRGKAHGKRRVRLAHRVIGVIAAPLLFSFGLSGLFHALAPKGPEAPAPASFSVASLAAPRIVGAVETLSATADQSRQPIWRALSAGQSYYFDASGVLMALDDGARARSLISAPPDAPTELLTQFSEEYGFANKRLPVWRVTTPDAVRFVEVDEGVVAAIAPSDLAALEAWCFSVIHKWQFLNPIGKFTRDLLMMLAVLLVAATSVLGLRLKTRTRPLKETSR